MEVGDVIPDEELFGDGAPSEETSAALWVKGNYIFSSEE